MMFSKLDKSDGSIFLGVGAYIQGLQDVYQVTYLGGAYSAGRLCTGDKLIGFYSISIEEKLTKKMNVKVNFCGEAKFWKKNYLCITNYISYNDNDKNVVIVKYTLK